MSKSVARQHMKLLLARTSLIDASVQQQDEDEQFEHKSYEEKKALAAKKRSAQEMEVKKPTGKEKNIVNPFIQAVDQFQGSTIEITRQLKKAKRTVKLTSANTTAANEKAKKEFKAGNLQILALGKKSSSGADTALTLLSTQEKKRKKSKKEKFI